mmetsp:Transcript_54444/g.129341  ORF Transcript_54444/g.129341 Transcript_54444/m.129341 type:complete len:231 (+) Transcript_54444:192-884(+)
MLPDVEAQEGDHLRALHPVHQRVVLVRGRRDDELAVRGDAEPRPPGAEARRGRFAEGLLHLVDGAEGRVDGLGESRRGRAAGRRGAERAEEQPVVVEAPPVVADHGAVLRGLVCQRVLLDLGEGNRAEVKLLELLVEVGQVRLKVLVMVNSDGGFVHVRLQRVIRIRQRREGVSLDSLRAGRGGRHRCSSDACEGEEPRRQSLSPARKLRVASGHAGDADRGGEQRRGAE